MPLPKIRTDSLKSFVPGERIEELLEKAANPTDRS
jgi:hypothetical protein